MRIKWTGVALAAIGATGCLNVPTLATITPQYGFVDGCVDLTIQGHHMGEEATLVLSNEDNELELELTPPEYDDTVLARAQDIGFLFTASIPAGALPAGAGGFFDATLVVDDFEDTIPDGWYFRNCPNDLAVEGEVFADPLIGGSTVLLFGCGMDVSTVTATVYDVDCNVVEAGIALTSVCGTTDTSFSLPTGLADGDYTMTLDGPNGEYDLGFAADPANAVCQGLSFTVAAPEATP